MEQYCFTSEQRAALERMKVPFAIYQFLDRRVVALILTDGFCALLGYTDRARAYSDMDRDMYKDVHPDDVSRIANAAVRFATGDSEEYDVIYRTRIRGGDGYRLVHAKGEHFTTDDGVRLAQVWYMDEADYPEGDSQNNSRLITAMRDALHEESFLRANRYDDLTGLPNMTYFFELAVAEQAKARRGGGQLTILYVNVCGMRFYNSKYGFSEGDRLLQGFAKLLAETFGNENCSRFGQDHFAVFTRAEGLEETLEQLFEAARSLNGGNSLPVQVGICRDWDEDEHISKACDRAKVACDRLRRTYDSCCGTYDDAARKVLRRRQAILTNLDKAIAEKWIRVYYQPIVRAANGRVCDEECLARWIDPEEGMLSPDEFIPYLEDSGQIYRLDLCVLEQVLEKIRTLEENGIQIVPQSINLSRSDFDHCDMVEEIRKRTDAAGVSRKLIAIEITESIIGSDFEHMREQIARFRALGFPVWLDDFGSGYSSLDALQSIPFDLVKFDMSFMRKLDESQGSRIVLTELMKLVTSLGMDAVCEGVETQEQMRFLQEIGCSKLQGFLFSRPNPLEELLKRSDSGVLIGFENPDEVPYYEAIGKVNLYDLGMIGDEGETNLNNTFSTLPMGIIEVRGLETRFVRSNQAYRDFVKRFLGYDLSREGTDFVPYGDAFMNNIVKTCCELGIKSFYDEQMPNGAVVHSFARRISVNPVNGTVAVAVAVLSISEADEGATYAGIARALASDYINIYYVDLDTEHFIEYSSPMGGEGLAMERHGEQFFSKVTEDARTRVYPEDRNPFLSMFNKENIERELTAHGVFTTTYRLIGSGKPTYAHMKITRMQPGGQQIIIGVSLVDAQMKQRELLNELHRQQEALARVMALSADYLSIYTVEPDLGHFVEYKADSSYRTLGLLTEGEDFFQQGIEKGKTVVYPEDLPRYLEVFTKENILRAIRETGFFQMRHRLVIDGVVTPITLRIARLEEAGGGKLIAGIRLREVIPAPAPDAPEKLFQHMADQLLKPCAILSVERRPDSTPGMIRIVCANKEYKDAMGSKYYDNMPYYELVPKVARFEHSCYRCAILHQQIHNYTQTKADGLWTDQQLIPLHSDREDIGYCQFILELSETVNREQMSAVSIRMASAVLKAAITLMGTNDLKERVGTVLQDILELSEAFQVRMLLVDHENKRAINYCDRMVITLPENFVPPDDDPDGGQIQYPLLCSWEDCIGPNNNLLVTNEEEMRDLEQINPAWVRSMRPYGVTSLLLIPLRHDKEIIGYLYLCNFNPEKSTEIRELSEMMSFFLATEIYNEILLEKLDTMSRTDALTGLSNRNAMIQRTKQLTQSGEPMPYGIINLDLNGLKTVNDMLGHDAGDRLLITAAETLKKYFYEEDVYRTGGDEFIVIATGITRETFERKVERLRRANEEGKVSFAIGDFWSDGSTEVNAAFRAADERMYQDKNAFYASHPEQKR